MKMFTVLHTIPYCRQANEATDLTNLKYVRQSHFVVCLLFWFKPSFLKDNVVFAVVVTLKFGYIIHGIVFNCRLQKTNYSIPEITHIDLYSS